jgi:hypothetical protein
MYVADLCDAESTEFFRQSSELDVDVVRDQVGSTKSASVAPIVATAEAPIRSRLRNFLRVDKLCCI